MMYNKDLRGEKDEPIRSFCCVTKDFCKHECTPSFSMQGLFLKKYCWNCDAYKKWKEARDHDGRNIRETVLE